MGYDDSPIYGNSACPLCRHHKQPYDLNIHVTESKTCADVHLELSLYKQSDNKEKCSAAQKDYRAVCCTKPSEAPARSLQVGVAAIAGTFVLWFVSKKLFSMKVGVAESLPTKDEKNTSTDYNRMEDSPAMKESTSKPSNRSPKKPKAAQEIPALKPVETATSPEKTIYFIESTESTETVQMDEDTSMIAMWNGTKES